MRGSRCHIFFESHSEEGVFARRTATRAAQDSCLPCRLKCHKVFYPYWHLARPVISRNTGVKRLIHTKILYQPQKNMSRDLKDFIPLSWYFYYLM
jgi:hypothetical protein